MSDLLVEKLKEVYTMDRLREVNKVYKGEGELVLILGLNEDRAHELTNSIKETFLSVFKSINKWDENQMVTSRLVRVRCYGIPLMA